MIGSDAILPIEEEEEPDLELALERAVERQIECPAGSFSLTEGESPHSDLSEQIDGFDDVMSSDETKRLTEKRKQRNKRAASEDSGISASTYLSAMRGRDRNTSASNSDYCGDSEGYVGDDVKHPSDVDSFSDSQRDNDVALTYESETVISKDNFISKNISDN